MIILTGGGFRHGRSTGDRPRSLAAELRKLVEPPVVHPVVIEEDGPYTHNPAVNEVLPTTEGTRDLEFDPYGLTPDQLNSIKEIDPEGGARRLDNLSERVPWDAGATRSSQSSRRAFRPLSFWGTSGQGSRGFRKGT